LISKIYRKGAKGRNPKYTGCIQGTPKEQGKENNCLRNQNRNNHVPKILSYLTTSFSKTIIHPFLFEFIKKSNVKKTSFSRVNTPLKS
jgi:hypothetical protein